MNNNQLYCTRREDVLVLVKPTMMEPDARAEYYSGLTVMQEMEQDNRLRRWLSHLASLPIEATCSGEGFEEGKWYKVEEVEMKREEVFRISAYGIETRCWTKHDKYGYGCSECCNGDRCDDDCIAKYNRQAKNCPHCKGEGWIPVGEAVELSPFTASLRPVKKEESGGYYYNLFKFFSDNHGLTLVDTEIQDIIHAVESFKKKNP